MSCRVKCPLKPSIECPCTSNIANEGHCICPLLYRGDDLHNNDMPRILVDESPEMAA